jgi:hypothetical protein
METWHEKTSRSGQLDMSAPSRPCIKPGRKTRASLSAPQPALPRFGTWLFVVVLPFHAQSPLPDSLKPAAGGDVYSPVVQADGKTLAEIRYLAQDRRTSDRFGHLMAGLILMRFPGARHRQA